TRSSGIPTAVEITGRVALSEVSISMASNPPEHGTYADRRDKTQSVNSSLLGRLLSFIARVLHMERERPTRPDPGVLYRGDVAYWHAEEGWGAVRTPQLAGVGFMHFSHIRGMEG